MMETLLMLCVLAFAFALFATVIAGMVWLMGMFWCCLFSDLKEWFLR